MRCIVPSNCSITLAIFIASLSCYFISAYADKRYFNGKKQKVQI